LGLVVHFLLVLYFSLESFDDIDCSPFPSLSPFANKKNKYKVAYITDRYSGKTRTTTMVEVQSLADSFAASLGGRRRLADSDAFADFMLNLTSTLMDDAAAVGSSEDMYKNANQLVSVANSPSGSAGMSTDKQVEFVGGLVTNMINAAETMDITEENTQLMFGSYGSVANGQPGRMNDAAQVLRFLVATFLYVSCFSVCLPLFNRTANIP